MPSRSLSGYKLINKFLKIGGAIFRDQKADLVSNIFLKV